MSEGEAGNEQGFNANFRWESQPPAGENETEYKTRTWSGYVQLFYHLLFWVLIMAGPPKNAPIDFLLLLSNMY